MFTEAFLAVLAGLLVGTFTGLTPGVHINLVALLTVSFSPVLLQYVPPVHLAIFIMAMSITHTFLDALPGIYLGAPSTDEALNVLPGHRLLLQGKGHQAVLYTVIGALFVIILSLLLFPLFLLAMSFLQHVVEGWVGVLLVAVMGYMILKEATWKKRVLALLFFLMAGCLGMLVFSLPMLEQPLFPLLSGLFGFSILLVSLHQNTAIPAQNLEVPLAVKPAVTAKATTAASVVGFLAAFLPGFGSSQAAILSTQVVGDIGDEGFLVLVGGINTANMLISLATAYLLGKARNGSIVALYDLLGEVSLPLMLVLLAVCLLAAGLSAVLAIRISRGFSSILPRMNYTLVVGSILAFVTVLTFYFDGFFGLLILGTATSIGLLAGHYGTGKNHLMGCLILPVILYFLL